MARLLFAWEQGGGLGHIVRFNRLIAEFKKRGHAISVALPHVADSQRLDLAHDNIKIIPHWPGRVRYRQNRKKVTYVTYGDIFGDILFTDVDEIAGRIALWRRVFEETKPDIIIADFAPGAVLAARDFMRCINVGDGYSLPPHAMENFPRLWPGDAPLKHREADVANRISAALSRFGATPLRNYPDLNAATAHATMTIPMLDLYREWRADGWLGAGPFTLPTTAPDERSGLFVSLHEEKQLDERLMEGIAESGVGGTVVIPNLLRRNRKLFGAAGFRMPDELLPLNEALESARVLVHLGGMGVAHAGIAKGVPQLIIQNDLEKYHVGKAIADAGAGISLDYRTITKQKISTALRTLAQETVYLDRALQLAKDNSALLKTSSITGLCDLTESFI